MCCTHFRVSGVLGGCRVDGRGPGACSRERPGVDNGEFPRRCKSRSISPPSSRLVSRAPLLSIIVVFARQHSDVRSTACSHKLYGPTGIGVLYGKQRPLEAMPPWQGGGDMIMSVTFERTTYAPPPAKFRPARPTSAVPSLSPPPSTTSSRSAWPPSNATRPSCDHVTVYLDVKDGVVRDISFQGEGCAIARASASMMTSVVKGKSLADASETFKRFHQMIAGGQDPVSTSKTWASSPHSPA